MARNLNFQLLEVIADDQENSGVHLKHIIDSLHKSCCDASKKEIIRYIVKTMIEI